VVIIVGLCVIIIVGGKGARNNAYIRPSLPAEEARVSPEPQCSSKASEQAKRKTTPKKGGTRYEKEKSITPQREDIPQRQLRSSTKKRGKRKVAGYISDRKKNRPTQQAHCHLDILRISM
jgi:hypothetical protein